MYNFYLYNSGLTGNTNLCIEGDPPDSPEEAMQMAIDKWRFIVKAHQADPNLQLHNIGGNTCGLCLFYFDRTKLYERCGLCPVSLSGFEGCFNSPFYAYDDNPCVATAQAELDFLLLTAEAFK